MFQKAIDLFHTFRQTSFDKEGKIDAQAAEIGNKITQLQWLINYAQNLNNRTIQSLENQVDINAMFELEIITESFYHFAWRIIEITKHLKGFDEIKKTKVSHVRNYLIQHPETQKDRAKFYSSFSAGGKSGPVIKGYIGPPGSLNDEGLFINAEEFNSKLCKCLETAISKL